MAAFWNKLKLQAKFALVVGVGMLLLAAATVAGFGYREFSNLEARLRTVSEREVSSLNALVDSAMRVRLEDEKNVGLKVYEGWFDSRNKEYEGKLWSVWGPSTASYMARAEPSHAAKVAIDEVDREALRASEPIGRFLGETYRFSLPIVHGKSLVMKQDSCVSCHGPGMGAKEGDVIAVFSSSLPIGKDVALVWQRIWGAAAIAGALIVSMLAAIWWIFGRVVAKPICRLSDVLGDLTNDRIVDVPFTERRDEVGSIARATDVFKLSIAEKVINLRVRAGLDVVKSSVMMADADYNIIYVNAALQEMMEEAESELRKAIPQFDAGKLIGASMDMFHKNPAHQRKLLDQLQRTHDANVNVGSQKFRMFATPVVDARGSRAGTVVEWRNVTAAVAIESEIDAVVNAAAAGDFSHRVPLAGKNEFMLRLAAAMNALCETTGKALHDLVGMLSALAKGDLTQRITADYQGMFGKLKADANTMADRIGATIAEIKASARDVASASAEISTSTTDLSQRTEEQAASLEQTSASMEEIAATVKKNADNAQAANQSAAGTRTVADRGGEVVAKAVDAMAKIEDSSRKIADILGVIDEIARQTNLLALNAAVEAARAGEAGRGFAVVASEVRSLAQRSSQAAKDIKDLITNSNNQVKDGVDLVNKAGTALTDIVESIKQVAAIVAEIANASAEQASGIEQVNKALTQMDEVTQRTRHWSRRTPPPPRRWSSKPKRWTSASRSSSSRPEATSCRPSRRRRRPLPRR